MSQKSEKIDPMIVLNEQGLFAYHAFLVNPELFKQSIHKEILKEENKNE